MKKKVNYLNNKDILKEIHKSKLSFCYALDPAYMHYDLIVTNIPDHNDKIPYIKSIDDIDNEFLWQAKENQAARLSNKAYEEGIHHWYDELNAKGIKPKQIEFKVDAESIDVNDIVIRVMTFEHIPLELNRKKNPKVESDLHARCNFPPFKHYAFINGEWKEVVRSHWAEGFDNGVFKIDHGKITPKLASMMIKLCDRYSMRSNWRGYTYVEEMRGSALVQLSQVGLQFDESRSQNPFAYYTATINNSFTRVLNLEKRNQNIRDDILQDNGYLPSFSRQIDDEKAQQDARHHDDQIAADATELQNAGYNF